jgi:hypothetical protein
MGSLDSVNRATLPGFVRYYRARPYHFADLFGTGNTVVNVEAAWKTFQDMDWVVAARVSPHCQCELCAMHKRYQKRPGSRKDGVKKREKKHV